MSRRLRDWDRIRLEQARRTPVADLERLLVDPDVDEDARELLQCALDERRVQRVAHDVMSRLS